MKIFNDFTDDQEGMNAFMNKQFEDDQKIKNYLDTCSHKEFNFAILNIGDLLKTISIYFGFIDPQIQEAIKNKQGTSRKMNKFIKDLNQKINLRYELDEDLNIVENLVLYNGELYLFINKNKFLEILLDEE